ncbi:MAG: Radical domain protein [Fibrobacteres bacterium]|nr:Radical domain protein [Fibrobacterota bacterium]
MTSSIGPILERAVSGARISPREAYALLRSPDWTSIVAAGHQRRLRLHDPSVVSYTAYRVINYTNFCDVDCSFCSFKDEIESDRGYTLTLDEIAAKTEEALALGVDHIFIQGGVNPKLPLSYYTDALRMLSGKYRVHVRGFSPVELLRLARKEGMPLPELLSILKDAGLGSVPGAGAEVLTDRMRQILSPKKLSGEDWCHVMGECHKMGLPGSSNIVFGSVETEEDVCEHLTLIRDQQDRTGGFLAFIPWTFQPQTKKFTVRHVRGWEYLRLIAVSRLFLDNIPNIEVSVLGMGKDLGELALNAGANDINSIVIEENVLRSSGLKTLGAAVKFIKEAGFTPARRTLGYEFGKYPEAAA